MSTPHSTPPTSATLPAEAAPGDTASARALSNGLFTSAPLTSSLDFDAMVAHLAEAVVPALGDWSAVNVRSRDGELEQAARAGAETPVPLGDVQDARLQRVLESGKPVLAPEHPAGAAVRDGASGTDQQAAAWLAVPLRAHGQVVGVLVCGRLSGPLYTAEDLALAEDLVRLAGPAVDGAWHYRELEQAIRVREQVLGTVAHDLHSPLTSIEGQADLLGRQAAAGRLDPERVRARAAAIGALAGRMKEQIAELVDAARGPGCPAWVARRANAGCAAQRCTSGGTQPGMAVAARVRGERRPFWIGRD